MRLALAAAMLLASASAQAAVINFEADSGGGKPNGFVSASGAGVSFSDTLGANLNVSNFGIQGIGTRSLGVFGDDASRLRMDFDSPANELSLVFGNDDSCCSTVGDRAWLELYDGGTLVGTVSVTMNRNDLADQTISYAGAAFNNALFWYGNASGTPTNLTEIVDNVTFNTATATPEPASLALFGAGLLGLAGLRRRR